MRKGHYSERIVKKPEAVVFIGPNDPEKSIFIFEDIRLLTAANLPLWQRKIQRWKKYFQMSEEEKRNKSKTDDFPGI